jgi:hypothetical protein
LPAESLCKAKQDTVGFVKDYSPHGAGWGWGGGMDHDIICSWLAIPLGTWPPDHYLLLGLQPGEDRLELIEQRVHERLDAVRRYQICRPEQATEAMNRLAQAFVCLTEANAKQAYDRELGIVRPTAAPTTVVQAPARVEDPLDWLSVPTTSALPTVQTVERLAPPAQAVSAGPPPLPATFPSYSTPPPLLSRKPPPLPPLLPSLEETEPVADMAEEPTAPPPAPVPLPEPVDPVLEAARTGPACRRIATRWGIYQRITRTRQLLRLWQHMGRYLRSPKRRLARSTEGPELLRLLEETSTWLAKFPPLLGEAGQPGYLVLALTQVDTIKVFQSFSAHQREALSRDWSAAIKLLNAHRDYLRQELRAMRRRPFRQQLCRAGWSLIVDQPGAVLLLLSLVALNLALWHSYAEALWDKLFSR